MKLSFGIACLITAAISGPTLEQHADHGQHEQHNTQQPASADASRQAEVAERGTQVMPFDLDRSTHVFDPSTTGGIQTVISKDGAADQVALIRQHLQEEAAAFAEGDYRSPASIHGAEMPGLDQLSQAGDRVQVAYEAIDDGARIRFTSTDPELVVALHAWFDAQVADHGAHAEHGSSH